MCGNLLVHQIREEPLYFNGIKHSDSDSDSDPWRSVEVARWCLGPVRRPCAQEPQHRHLEAPGDWRGPHGHNFRRAAAPPPPLSTSAVRPLSPPLPLLPSRGRRCGVVSVMAAPPPPPTTGFLTNAALLRQNKARVQGVAAPTALTGPRTPPRPPPGAANQHVNTAMLPLMEVPRGQRRLARGTPAPLCTAPCGRRSPRGLACFCV